MSAASPTVFSPLTEPQKRARQLFHDCDVMALSGEAGSGKTHTSMALAGTWAFKRKARVLVSRPLVAVDDQLGFLPGKLEQKMHPWLLPLHDVLRRMTCEKPEQWLKDNCEVCPLAYVQGRTFDNTVAILDEAQNATLEQIRAFLTRLGSRGKVILCGDPFQSFHPRSGFAHAVSALRSSGLPGVAVVDLTCAENPRHPLIPGINRALSPQRSATHGPDSGTTGRAPEEPAEAV